MNTVEVDEAGLNAEVDATLRGVKVEPSPEQQQAEQAKAQEQLELEQAERAAMAYRPGCAVAVEVVAKVVMPNWQLTADEKDALSAQFATAMGLWFPNMSIHPKWMALLGVGGMLFQIAASRRGTPMRKRAEQKEGEEQGTEGNAPAAA